MTSSEKVAYIKGLAEGMKIDDSTNEGKLLLNILDVLEDITLDMEDIEDGLVELSEQVDAVDEDLDSLEEVVYEDILGDDDDCDCGCDCCDGDEFYEVECPLCNTEFEVDEESLINGEVECPNCGELLTYDFDCCEEGCDCGCDCCGEEE